MIGKRLKRARIAAGLSMQILGEKVGVSGNMIKKYEYDASMPSSAILLKLAATLGVRTEFFFRPAKIELTKVKYWKKANTPTKIIKKIEADVLEQAERWQELANLWPNYPVPDFSLIRPLSVIHSLSDIEQIALEIRTHWQLGINPLPDMIDLLESKGILIIVTQIEQAEKFDGLQAYVGQQPVIVISAHWSGCRQRFTLARQLGYLLLHDKLPPKITQKQIGHRFASAFLLPAPKLLQHLGESRHHIDPRELYLLKHEYGLSMAACLRRAADLKVITPAKYKSLSMTFSANGWQKQEPGEAYPQERTFMFQQLVYRALAEEIISESKAAELLAIPLMQLHKSRAMQAEVD